MHRVAYNYSLSTRAGLLTALLCSLSQTAMTQALPEFNADSRNQSGLTFSPDGETAYWVEWDGAWGSDPVTPRTIYFSDLENDDWSGAAPVPFSSGHADDDPFVSPDGQWLYFVSDRPAGADDVTRDADIWRYHRDDGRLEHLRINSEADEYSPVVTNSGALYFASARDGGLGQGDLYRAAAEIGGFAEPENIGAVINSATGEWNLWVSGDESEIIFEASSRPTNVSIPGDLYYSWRGDSGWTAAVPLADLNSSGSDLLPRLHADGGTLYYTTAPIGGHARIAFADWPAIRDQARAGYAPVLLVANRSSQEVVFVDLTAGRVINRVATGAGPHLLSNVSDGRVLATGYGEFPEPHAGPVSRRPPFVESLNSRLTMIDTDTGSVLLETTLEDCEKPHASWIVGQRAFVTCETEQQLAVVSLDDGSIVQRIPTGQRGSHVIAHEPGSQTLAVSNTDSGSVTLTDIDSGDTRIVDLPDGSEGSLALDGRFWIANAFDGSASIVDPDRAEVVKQIDDLCRFPIALAPDRDGGVWVACFASSELVRIDQVTFEIKRRITLAEQPLNLLIHPTRPLAYASLPRQNAVAEIDLVTGEEIRRITVGIEPDGLRWGSEK